MTPGSSAARLCRLVALLARHAAAETWWRAFDWLPIRRRRPPLAERVRRLAEEAGGAAVKLGQMMSTHFDLLPAEYCQALSGLVDELEGFSYEEVEKIFLEELGEAPSHLFDHFNPEPVAAGSIGQIHRATWRGQPMAVKVRRPSVPHDFAADLALLRILTTLVEYAGLRSLMWLVTPIREFIQWTAEEIDFSAEARRQEEFAASSGSDSWRRVPRVYAALSSPRILTMDWLDGPTVMDLMRARNRGEEPTGLSGELALRLVKGFFHDALVAGLFHGDLHPANLLVLPGDRVGYVDFGITGRLDETSCWHLMAMTAAHANADARGVASSFFELALPRKDCDYDGFLRGLSALQGKWAERWGSPSAPSTTRVMMDLLHLSRQTGIWPCRSVVRYIRSVIVLDGLVKNLTPGHDLQRELLCFSSDFLAWRLLPPGDGRLTEPPAVPPAPKPAAAEEELENLRLALRRFGFGRRAVDGPEPAGGSGTEAGGDRYAALWETEGRAYRRAEASGDVRWAVARAFEEIAPAIGPGPEYAALHVGASLSKARSLLGRRTDGESPALPEVLQQFRHLCEDCCPPGCEGLSWEALGLVARTLRPDRLRPVDRLLQGDEPRGHFWHGVGRGLYFLYPRALFTRHPGWLAYKALVADAPDTLAHRNGLAGLAFALTLINLRSPRVLESYLVDHGQTLFREVAFVNGMTKALLLWLHWAGPEENFNRLWTHRVSAGDGDLEERWKGLVQRACEAALGSWEEESRRPGGFSHLFRYSPVEPSAA